MTTLSIDYSMGRPSPAAIRAAGYVGVWRYLSTDPAKNLSPAERDALHAAGLGIGLVWETTADRSLSGSSGGAADGQAAAAQARALGMPAGSPLLAALADFAATPDQIPAIHDYYYAFRTSIGGYQPGGYATGYVIDQLVAAGAEGLWWQSAEDDQGIPGSTVSAHASVYQRVTPTRSVAGTNPGDFDEDIEGFGPSRVNWWMPGAALPPWPVPAGLAAQAQQPVRWPVTLSWTLVPGCTAYQYEIESGGQIVTDATDATGASVTAGLPPGTYRFRVVAHMSATHDWSAWSAWSDEFTLPVPAAS